LSSNYAWNRYWTFGPGSGLARLQAARFFAVSVASLMLNLVALELLVAAEMPELQAQALAVALAMPFNFLGNRALDVSLAAAGPLAAAAGRQ